MNRYADLHIHSTHSDGAWSPDRILEEAVKRNLHTIAITDHDTISGSVYAWQKGKNMALDILIGIEFSCAQNGEDIHILGYFLHDVTQQLEGFLASLQKRRQDRARKMLLCFQELDIDLSHMDLDGFGDSIGRPHFAKELMRMGIVKSFDEAFEKYLKHGRPCYIEKTKLTVKECLDLIRSSGGASVIAHPGFIKKAETLESILIHEPDGLEVYHSKHNQHDKIRFYNAAKERNMIITGGSDFHEETKSFLVGIGTEKIPVRYVEQLKERIEENARNR